MNLILIISKVMNHFESKNLDYYRSRIDSELKRTKEMVDEAIKSNGHLPEAVFDLRSTLYGLAMEMAGESRSGDLQAMRELINPLEGETSVDIAAGTGFLTKSLAEWTKGKTYAIDPSEGQIKILKGLCSEVITVIDCPENQSIFTVIREGEIDIVSSFGGIHHNKHQRDTFENVAKMLREGGRFCSGDVAKDSILSKHFDEIVKYKCLTGHDMGKWLSEDRLQELCRDLPLEVIRAEMKTLTWDFKSEEEMVLFFKGLHAYDLPDEEVIEDLGNTLGYKNEDGLIKLNWPMLLFEIIKKAK